MSKEKKIGIISRQNTSGNGIAFCRHRLLPRYISIGLLVVSPPLHPDRTSLMVIFIEERELRLIDFILFEQGF
jgi:hypothetical protein